MGAQNRMKPGAVRSSTPNPYSEVPNLCVPVATFGVLKGCGKCPQQEVEPNTFISHLTLQKTKNHNRGMTRKEGNSRREEVRKKRKKEKKGIGNAYQSS